MRDNVNVEQVLRFLNGVNDGFEYVQSKVLLTVPLPYIKTIFNLAINYERQKTCNNPIMSQVILAHGVGSQAVLPAYVHQQPSQGAVSSYVNQKQQNQAVIPTYMNQNQGQVVQINALNFSGRMQGGKKFANIRGECITVLFATIMSILWKDAIRSMVIHHTPNLKET